MDLVLVEKESLKGFSLVYSKIEARETEAPNHVVVADVNVTLLDENDNSPTFEKNTYEGTVSKNQTAGMLVTQVSHWRLPRDYV